MINSLRRIKPQLVEAVRKLVTRKLDERVYESLLLQGRIASLQVRSMESIRSLQDVEFKVFSQWGEDGIIDWLVERAGIPVHLHTFVEFGVETYLEANTRFLIENRNWRGLVMDGDPALRETLRRSHRYYGHDLKAESVFITRENINDLLAKAGFCGELGLLSIDVDGNDYWIWEAINVIQPVICICEYNAIFGDVHPVSIPYDPKFVCGQNQSLAYFGGSIAALRLLATRKGYKFLGTTLGGNDAFFIRNDYDSRLDGALRNIVAMPSRARIPRDRSRALPWLGGYDRFKAISDLPLVNTETGAIVTLNELGPAYSDDWLPQTYRDSAK